MEFLRGAWLNVHIFHRNTGISEHFAKLHHLMLLKKSSMFISREIEGQKIDFKLIDDKVDYT